MASLNIPARTIAQGVTTFGPVATGAGLSGMELDLDIGQLVAPCSFTLEIAFDGQAWQTVAQQLVSGPPVDKRLNPIVPPVMRWNANFGNNTTGQMLTTGQTRARLTIDNTQAFDTAGGSLTTA